MELELLVGAIMLVALEGGTTLEGDTKSLSKSDFILSSVAWRRAPSSFIASRMVLIVFTSCALGLKRQLKLELFLGAIVVVAQEVEGSICLDFNFGALDAEIGRAHV